MQRLHVLASVAESSGVSGVSESRPAAVIVLAAGEGTRMKSKTPKVLHELCGRSMLAHVLGSARALEPEQLVVVVGHGRDAVTAHLAAIDPAAKAVVQEPQRGTGHAVRTAVEEVGVPRGTVVVGYGDTPLLRAETLAELTRAHEAAGNTMTVLSAEVPDPTGYGRVIRDTAGAVREIVEDKDASPEQREIREINSGVYALDGGVLASAINRVSTDNAQGEEYLTDVLGILRGDGRRVGALVAREHTDILGINDRVQFAEVHRLRNERLLTSWMRAGVTVVDPRTTWLDVEVTCEPDAVIHPHTQLTGRTHVAEGATVGPECTLRDTHVGAGATVCNAVCEEAQLGPEVAVGPYAYLRPGTRLAPGAKAGTYVETKNAEIGAGTKVPHLSYVGDATIGEGTNIGAATVFVNHDGRDKHHSTVGDHAFVGCDTMLVAPAHVGDGAYTAAGSVITDEVPPGALGVARGRQRNIAGWVEHRRSDTPSADAARRAGGDTGGQRPAEDASTDEGA